MKQEVGVSNLSVHTCQATRRHRPAGCSLYPPKEQVDRVEQRWNGSEEEESVGWGTKLGSEGGRGRERERMIKGRNGGEVGKRRRRKVANRREKKGKFVMTMEKYKNKLKRLEILNVPRRPSET